MVTVSILHASQLDIPIAYICTYIHANSHHLLAQVGAILEERVAHQGGVDGKPDLGVESLDHGLDWNGKVMEESVPLRQKMRSYGSLEISRIENEASGHGVTGRLRFVESLEFRIPRRKTRFDRAR